VFLLRFGMRSISPERGARSEMYRAALDMAEWADSRRCVGVAVSEHHASDDGYLPSPVPMAAALAARTTTVPITVAALLLALYEPVKLAEDLAVVDLLSRGRVSYVVGIGYRDEEFAMFGVDRRRRAALTEARVQLLRRLWSGAPVEVEGRQVRVTPAPYTPGGPMLAYGGGSAAAARRAGRLGMFFVAESHDAGLEGEYLAAAEAAGVEPAGCFVPPAGVPLTVFVADDPDRAWAEIGEYLLADARGYARWNRDRPRTASVSHADSVSALENERGAYQIVTPHEAASLVASGMPLGLQPLVGGIPPDVAWPYLEAAASVCDHAG
jgi:alkanesulfonate monooxygenase SsuD/methylene tetrahydromethanopterin reductase-like flavin-dependent oxidoreductase (luciferase family)